MKKMLVAASLMGISMFTACKKDDSKSVSSKDVPKTLMGKKWRLTDYQYTYAGSTVNGYAMMDACAKDNTMEFKASSDLEAATNVKCDPSEKDVETGKWELRSGNTEIYVSGATSLYGITDMTLKIVTLNSKMLKVSYVTTIGGPSIESVATYAPL
jgi:hypothetical protein